MKLLDTDILIASIALENGMTLVTGNTKHFERIEGLELENWFAQSVAVYPPLPYKA